MLIIRPKHNKYLLHDVDDTTYKRLAEEYALLKRYGIRGVYAFAAGIGALEILRSYIKGKIILYSKEKLAVVVVNTVGYISSPIVYYCTSSSKIIKVAFAVHTACAEIFECIEDAGNVPSIPFDFLFFGQYIPVGENGRFNILKKFKDLF
jgi:hypothetical protein